MFQYFPFLVFIILCLFSCILYIDFFESFKIIETFPTYMYTYYMTLKLMNA